MDKGNKGKQVGGTAVPGGCVGGSRLMVSEERVFQAEEMSCTKAVV